MTLIGPYPNSFKNLPLSALINGDNKFIYCRSIEYVTAS